MVLAPLRFNSSPLKFNSSPLKFNSSPLKFNSSPLKFNSSPLKFNSSPLKFNSSPLKFNSSPLKFNSSPLKLNSSPLKLNSSPLKNDGWKMSFLLGLPIFRGYVKFPGCTSMSHVAHPFLLVKNGPHSLQNGHLPCHLIGFFLCQKRIRQETQRSQR